MAAIDLRPRFFKVFISHFSADSMMIPISYYDQFPRLLPKTAILQGPSGCFWNVEMKYKRDEVYFGHGWTKFVKDNSLIDGNFLTFVYNGDRIFEVSIYSPDGCKAIRSVIEVEDDKKNSICSLSSENTETSSESEMINTRRKSKEEVVEDSDDEDDSIYSLSSEEMNTDTEIDTSIFKKKGKTKEKEVMAVCDEDSDNDYIEGFSLLEFSESSDSDCSYSSKKKVIKQNQKKKGKSKLIEEVEGISDDCMELEAGKKARKVRAKIKNPEAYLDNPNNVYFETAVKNRKYELLVHAQLVKDYCLKFEDRVNYIDKYGKLEAKTAKWLDQRVCIKKWIRICQRNKLKKEDRILCELLRKRDSVYAIKLHIIRGKDL